MAQKYQNNIFDDYDSQVLRFSNTVNLFVLFIFYVILNHVQIQYLSIIGKK